MKLNNMRTGCKDVFHAFMVTDADYDGELEFPKIEPQNEGPNRVINFSKSLRCNDANQWIHFYEDDYLFERIWNQPRKYLPLFKKYNGVILPDFSLYYDMPLVMQCWNIYRSRAIGTWLQRNGIKVIPNCRFGDSRTFDITCAGLAKHSIIAIGSIGCIQDKTYRPTFIQGTKHVIEHLDPSQLVIVGSVPQEIQDFCKKRNIPILQFESETKQVFRKGEN